MRKANESLSPKPLSSIWEERVYDAIFTGDMTKWLDVFHSPLHKLVEPPDCLHSVAMDLWRPQAFLHESDSGKVRGFLWNVQTALGFLVANALH